MFLFRFSHTECYCRASRSLIEEKAGLIFSKVCLSFFFLGQSVMFVLIYFFYAGITSRRLPFLLIKCRIRDLITEDLCLLSLSFPVIRDFFRTFLP